MTTDQITARNEVLATISSNIANIEAALETARDGEFVYFWPQYCLGVVINDNEVRVMGVEHATTFTPMDVEAMDMRRRSYRNGAGVSAQLVDRREALTKARAHSIEVMATLKAAMS
jgi:hypothetical protein